MQFQVPQFIEVEDKIIGPFTIKQFFYLIGAAGGSYLLWAFLPSVIAVVFIIPVAALGIALAFYKVNNRPFIFTVEAAVKYFFRGNLYIWSQDALKKPQAQEETQPVAKTTQVAPLPKITAGKLRDLAWSLDVQEKIKQ